MASPPPDCTPRQAEIQLLERLKHPNVVRYLTTVRTAEHLNLVIECTPPPSAKPPMKGPAASRVLMDAPIAAKPAAAV